MNAEEILKQKIGNKSPFKVPEGYFESFTNKMMQTIDENDAKRKKRAKIIKMRFITSAAAAVVIAFISVTCYFTMEKEKEAVAQEQREQYIDDLCDYAMVKNADIYYCLAEENY